MSVANQWIVVSLSFDIANPLFSFLNTNRFRAVDYDPCALSQNINHQMGSLVRQGNQIPPQSLTAFFPLFGTRVWGPFGHFVDTVAVLATLFGLAVSLGFGAEQIAGGLNYLFGIPANNLVKIILIIVSCLYCSFYGS